MRRKERFATISEQAAKYSELLVLSSLLTSYATFDSNICVPIFQQLY